MIDKNFWKDKRVFVTGHTGFKGSWLSIWLSYLGAEVKGYALNPPTFPSLFNEAKIEGLISSQIGDIRDQDEILNSMSDFNPDILIHMAAQPLVMYSYEFPIETFDVNVLGTAKVLEAAKSCRNLKAIINVTTDKCYENDDRIDGYKEDDPMGGFDPYSSSKGCAELVSSSYRRSFLDNLGIGVSTVRTGNVIGGGDWADNRLIPDILRSFESGKTIVVRSPNATRPWQHVLEPLSGYLILAQKLYSKKDEFSEGWNFGPKDKDIKPVHWILDNMVAKWPNSKWKLDNNITPHEAIFLKLDILKAKNRLDWSPTWDLKEALDRVIDWHKSWISKEDMHRVCIIEIDNYMHDMQNST